MPANKTYQTIIEGLNELNNFFTKNSSTSLSTLLCSQEKIDEVTTCLQKNERLLAIVSKTLSNPESKSDNSIQMEISTLFSGSSKNGKQFKNKLIKDKTTSPVNQNKELERLKQVIKTNPTNEDYARYINLCILKAINGNKLICLFRYKTIKDIIEKSGKPLAEASEIVTTEIRKLLESEGHNEDTTPTFLKLFDTEWPTVEKNLKKALPIARLQARSATTIANNNGSTPTAINETIAPISEVSTPNSSQAETPVTKIEPVASTTTYTPLPSLARISRPNAALESEIARLEDLVAKAESSRQSLEAKITKLHTELETKDQRIADLGEELTKREAIKTTISALSSVTDANKRARELEEQLERITTAKSDAETTLSLLRSEYEKLKNELVESKSKERTESEIQLAKHNIEVGSLEKKVADLNQQQLKDAEKNNDATIHTLREELRQKQEELLLQKAAHDRQRDSLADDAKREVSSLKRQINQKEEQLLKARLLQEEAQDKLEELQSEKNALKVTLLDHKRVGEEQTLQIEQLERSVTLVKAELERERTKPNSDSETIEKLEVDLKQKKADLLSTQQELLKLKRTIAEQDNFLQEKQQELTEVSSSLRSKDAKSKELEQEFTAILEQLPLVIQQAKSDLKQLKKWAAEENHPQKNHTFLTSPEEIEAEIDQNSSAQELLSVLRNLLKEISAYSKKVAETPKKQESDETSLLEAIEDNEAEEATADLEYDDDYSTLHDPSLELLNQGEEDSTSQISELTGDLTSAYLQALRATDKLNATVEQLKKDKEAIESELQAKTEETETLARQLASTNEELDTAISGKETAETEVSKLQQEINVLKPQLQQAETKVEELKSFQNKFADAQDQLDTEKETIHRLQADKDDLTSKIATAEQLAEKTKEDLGLKADELANAKLTLQTEQEKNQQLTEELSVQKEKITQLDGLNDQLTIQNAASAQTLEENSEELNRLRTQLEGEKKKFDSLSKEKSASDTALSAIQENYAALESESKEKTETLARLNTELDSLREQLHAHEIEIGQLRSKIQSLEVEINEFPDILAQKVAKKEEEIETLKQAYEAKTNEIERVLQQQIDEITFQKEIAEKTLEITQQELESLNSRIEETAREATSLRKQAEQLPALQEQFGDLQQQVTDTTKLVAELQRTKEEIERERDAYKLESDNNQQRIEQLTRQHQALDEQTSQLVLKHKEELDAVKREKETADATARKLQQRISELEPLQEQLRLEQEKVTQNEKTIRELQQQVGNIHQLREDLQQAQQKAQTSEQNARTLQQRIRELEPLQEQLRLAQEQATVSEQTIQQLQLNVQEANRIVEEADRKAEEATERADRLQTQLREQESYISASSNGALPITPTTMGSSQDSQGVHMLEQEPEMPMTKPKTLDTSTSSLSLSSEDSAKMPPSPSTSTSGFVSGSRDGSENGDSSRSEDDGNGSPGVATNNNNPESFPMSLTREKCRQLIGEIVTERIIDINNTDHPPLIADDLSSLNNESILDGILSPNNAGDIAALDKTLDNFITQNSANDEATIKANLVTEFDRDIDAVIESEIIQLKANKTKKIQTILELLTSKEITKKLLDLAQDTFKTGSLNTHTAILTKLLLEDLKIDIDELITTHLVTLKDQQKEKLENESISALDTLEPNELIEALIDLPVQDQGTLRESVTTMASDYVEDYDSKVKAIVLELFKAEIEINDNIKSRLGGLGLDSQALVKEIESDPANGTLLADLRNEILSQLNTAIAAGETINVEKIAAIKAAIPETLLSQIEPRIKDTLDKLEANQTKEGKINQLINTISPEEITQILTDTARTSLTGQLQAKGYQANESLLKELEQKVAQLSRHFNAAKTQLQSDLANATLEEIVALNADNAVNNRLINTVFKSSPDESLQIHTNKIVEDLSKQFMYHYKGATPADLEKSYTDTRNYIDHFWLDFDLAKETLTSRGLLQDFIPQQITKLKQIATDIEEGKLNREAAKWQHEIDTNTNLKHEEKTSYKNAIQEINAIQAQSSTIKDHLQTLEETKTDLETSISENEQTENKALVLDSILRHHTVIDSKNSQELDAARHAANSTLSNSGTNNKQIAAYSHNELYKNVDFKDGQTLVVAKNINNHILALKVCREGSSDKFYFDSVDGNTTQKHGFFKSLVKSDIEYHSKNPEHVSYVTQTIIEHAQAKRRQEITKETRRGRIELNTSQKAWMKIYAELLFQRKAYPQQPFPIIHLVGNGLKDLHDEKKLKKFKETVNKLVEAKMAAFENSDRKMIEANNVRANHEARIAPAA